MKPVHTATFNGVKYDVDLCGPIDGSCDSPLGGKPNIRICTNLETQTGLETAIHESLHASFWAKTDEKVGQTARDIARLLWRLGYRKYNKI